MRRHSSVEENKKLTTGFYKKRSLVFWSGKCESPSRSGLRMGGELLTVLWNCTINGEQGNGVRVQHRGSWDQKRFFVLFFKLGSINTFPRR